MPKKEILSTQSHYNKQFMSQKSFEVIVSPNLNSIHGKSSSSNMVQRRVISSAKKAFWRENGDSSSSAKHNEGIDEANPQAPKTPSSPFTSLQSLSSDSDTPLGVLSPKATSASDQQHRRRLGSSISKRVYRFRKFKRRSPIPILMVIRIGTFLAGFLFVYLLFPRTVRISHRKPPHEQMKRFNTTLESINISSSDQDNGKELSEEMTTNIYYTYTDPKTSKIVRKRRDESQDTEVNTHSIPKTIFYAPSSRSWALGSDEESRKFQVDPILSVNPGEESAPQDHPKKPYIDGNCVPMQPWQTDSKPTCNTLHEIDLVWGRNISGEEEEEEIKWIGKGWFRHAWKVRERNIMNPLNGKNEEIILKTLRFDRNFYDEFYDLHRRDAMAMERLTASPYILDIYSFCGQSALNEIAVDSVEKVARFMRDDPSKNLYRLKMSAQVALGIADIHEIDGPSWNASMVHYDINPRNVATVESGSVKINDFNVAEFSKWDIVNKKPCGFKGRLHEPWWRAPEEMIRSVEKDGVEPPFLNEKVDIYALGNVLYRILTGHAPRGKSIPERIDEIRDEVAKGKPPRLAKEFIESEEPTIAAIRRAMIHCYQRTPEKRRSARDIGNELMDAYNSILNETKTTSMKKYSSEISNLALPRQGMIRGMSRQQQPQS